VWAARFLKRASASLALLAALAALVPVTSRAADDPARVLQAEFQAAKDSLSAGNLASAESHYVDTIALGLRQFAQLSLSQGQADHAAAYLDSALRLKPGDIETQVAAAGAWFRKGEVDKAKALLKSVVGKEPDHARAHGLLGRIYVFEGDSNNAIQELKTSLDLQDDFETGYFLGIAYLTAKKLPEASAWFHQLESRMGESAALHMMFGRAYLVTKIPQQAISEFRQVIKLDPKYPRAHGFLGYAYLEHFQEEGYPQAREEFEKELKLHPDEYQVQELLGIANVNLRDFLFSTRRGCVQTRVPFICTWARPTRRRIVPRQQSRFSRSTSVWWELPGMTSCARSAAHTTCLVRVCGGWVARRMPGKRWFARNRYEKPSSNTT
jgi:cytochrome c-type biogenesis protein CcmH/NrfG